MALTQVQPGMLASDSQYTGFKSRIINGAMVIDQRNAGASSALASTVYSLDRYMGFFSSSGTATVQRSTNAPTGFTSSLLVTVGTADASVGSGDYVEIEQRIEGYNVADLGFGGVNASTVTLSFWVRSSITGTYCVNLRNGANNRSYVAQYTISAANTWEQKTVTITGDTSGTWTTDNTAGLIVGFALMVGSTYQQAAGSWGSTSYGFGSSSQTNLMATSGATFYITGVQLEKGSTATSFDYRPYPVEFSMCQRYYQVVNTGSGNANGTGSPILTVPFQVTMRAAPTMGQNGVYSLSDYYANDPVQSAISISSFGTSTTGACIQLQNFTGLTIGRAYFGPRYISSNGNGFTASAEL
jgi:hypothetical protein